MAIIHALITFNDYLKGTVFTVSFFYEKYDSTLIAVGDQEKMQGYDWSKEDKVSVRLKALLLPKIKQW